MRVWLALLVVLCCSAAFAQKPDVQVMVAPGLPGRWLVSVVFPKVLPRPELQKRLEAITRRLGGRFGAVEMEDRSLDVGKDAGIAPIPMSSLTFATTAPVVDSAAGELMIVPFVLALRDLGRIQATYMTPPGFVYKGSRQITDNGVSLTLDEQPGVCTWSAVVANHDVAEIETQKPEAARTTDGAGRILAFGLVIVLAVGVALLTFGLLQKRLRPR